VTSSTTPPRLAVHVGTEVPASLATVLSAVSAWADVVAASVQEPLPEGMRAHLYTSDVLPRRPVAPYAVWRVPGGKPVDTPGVVVLGEAGTPETAPGDLTVCLLPWPEHSRLLLPFTRSRYRLLRDLPETLVAVATPGGVTWSSGGTPRRAPEGTWPTLAALASAVVARGDLVWDALAWGAPTVTDPETAQRLSLTPDEHVLVADDPTERRSLSLALASDECRAAGLGRRGWSATRVRRPERVAQELCRRLGLTPPEVHGPSGLRDALDALGAPHDSLIRRRAREAVAPLPGAVTSGWRPHQRSDSDRP
jgi:hypothetical protein